MQKYLRNLYIKINKNGWKITNASPKTYKQITELHTFCKRAIMVNYFFVYMVVISLLPFKPQDPYTTMHSILFFLRNLPPFLFLLLSIVNYSVIFIMAYTIISYAFVLLYFTTFLQIQYMLINDSLEKIGENFRHIKAEQLVDYEPYQRQAYRTICKAVDYHIKLNLVAKDFNESHKNVLVVHLFGCMLSQISLLFILGLFGGLSNPIAITLMLLESAIIALTYLYCGVVFQGFNDSITFALQRCRWESWNVATRRAMAIFMLNSVEQIQINAYIFLVDYNLFIWMIHKITNVYSALLFINPEAIQL
ncbi:unnamed protein product [Brassicogethes aeneus]|uniref:Odorant receptor n=1 Tax=Brassicogethes aeneus TaxID=1431903 RepID=A0A9P0BGW0_BRAAE|nr:unnamed protein product [Brassicogethes aeneus]